MIRSPSRSTGQSAALPELPSDRPTVTSRIRASSHSGANTRTSSSAAASAIVSAASVTARCASRRRRPTIAVIR